MDSETIARLLHELQSDVTALRRECQRIKEKVNETSRDLDRVWLKLEPGGQVPPRWASDL